MAGNYSSIDGVSVGKYEAEDNEPSEQYSGAQVEEMYYEPAAGVIHQTIVLGDGGVLSISIPVVANKSWNSFVASLPTWEMDD